MTMEEILREKNERRTRAQTIATFFDWKLLHVHWPVEGATFSRTVGNIEEEFKLERNAICALLKWIEGNER